jgi:hypothetical protein
MPAVCHHLAVNVVERRLAAGRMISFLPVDFDNCGHLDVAIG